MLKGLLLLILAATTQEVTKEPVTGVRNFARLETTVACAGATSAEALPEIKKMGFVSVVNLRLATENGAEVEKEEAAAKALGLRYYPRAVRRQTQSRCRRPVSRGDHHARHGAGIHPLRRRESRGHDVVDQAAGRRSVGRGARRERGRLTGTDQRGTSEVRDRVRKEPQTVNFGTYFSIQHSAFSIAPRAFFSANDQKAGHQIRSLNRQTQANVHGSAPVAALYRKPMGPRVLPASPIQTNAA